MHVLKLDQDLCTGCGACVDACFVNAIGWEGEGPALKYPDDCQLCAVCERACPAGALEIVPDWGSRHCPPFLARDGEAQS